MHAEFLQSHSQQQPRVSGVARHLSAHCDGNSHLLSGSYRRLNKAQHRRVKRIVKIVDLVIHAIDGNSVLDQIVGADGQKIQLAGEYVGAYRCCRHLDHGADGHGLVIGLPLVIELLTAKRDKIQHLRQLADGRQHRNHHAHGAVSGGAKNCAQLRTEQPRLFQAQAHGAQAQGRIGGQGRAGPGTVHLLVGAEIQRADRHRRALPGAYDFDICLILLLLVRRLLAIHEQVLRPVETDTLGAYLNGAIQIRG